MNYNDYKLNERVLGVLHCLGCTASTMSEAIEWVSGAFCEPVVWDDEENPTEVGVDGDRVYCYLEDYINTEAFLNDFVLRCCYEIEDEAYKRWQEEHSVRVLDEFAGEYSECEEASSVAEYVNEYYGRL